MTDKPTPDELEERVRRAERLALAALLVSVYSRPRAKPKGLARELWEDLTWPFR